jgi:hypothetical protein
MGLKTNVIGSLAVIGAWVSGADAVFLGKTEAIYPTIGAAETSEKCNASDQIQAAISLARKQFKGFPKTLTIAPKLNEKGFCDVVVKSNPGLQQMQPKKPETTAEIAERDPLKSEAFQNWSNAVKKFSK